MQKLKPSTNYRFSESDLQFVVELAKVGHVHLASDQVSLITTPGYDENASIDFKDVINEEKCDGLKLPHNWVIEWISGGKKGLHITFGVKKVVTMILLFLFLASCGPSRYLECPKSVNIVFNADSLPPCTHGLPNCKCLRLAIAKTDTVPEWMHVSMRPKAYVVAQMALSVRVDGICTQHLDCAGKPFPVHYTVGWCQGKDESFNRLVSQLK